MWTRAEILSLIAVILVLGGGIWGIIRSLLARDRNTVDKNEGALWKRLDELRSEQVKIKIEQGVLRERVRAMPDHDELHEKFEAMQEKLDKKLSLISQQVQEAFAAAASRFKCPHAAEDPSKRITLTDSGAKILAPLLKAAEREGSGR